MGLFGGLEADKYDRQYSDAYLAKRIAAYMLRYRWYMVGIVIGFTILSFVSAIRPVIISIGVDALVAQETTFWLLVGILLAAALAEYGANWLRRYLLSLVIGRMVAQLRKDAFASATARDLAFYDTNKTGKIVSRITSDTQEFGDVLLFTSDVISQLVSVAVLLVVLLSRSIPLTVIILLTTPVFFGTAMLFRNVARRVTRQAARAMAVVNDNIQESVTGISVAKNFRREAMIYSEFVGVNTLSYQTNLRRGMVLALIFPVLNFLIGFSTAIVLYSGAEAVLGGVISAGSWYLFIQGADRFFFPVINLSAFWSQFQQGLSAIERVFGLIDAENMLRQVDDQPAGNINGHIVFKNVDFGYTDDQLILKNFDLDIKQGESVAFVGHTGAGKSTIAKLVARFYEFQGGEICIDGRDIRTFDLPSYRARLGIVPQQPFLFSGTIMENVRYARPDATDEEIRELVYSVGNGEWLETLPDGLQSDVGERGARLSMGQRQLVSLLRVMVQKPAIFILDEATASVDPFTEVQIQEAVDMLLSQSTSILIAHRLSTVRSADRIIVLRDGGIIEEGSHESLMTQGGHYAELYNTYFRHQSLSYVEGSKSRLTQTGSD
ncbi:ABC transporter ATP-binding protein [Phototrophicus methaneseepsis]|uniref:ABC transporter ATP-binding protein n=1 Tax=Phototrophicus methaneseepsis TaxID=2710758 RepID=A0A7S8E789_9CHLR|nr:ABC transporter ATP-binding protein [Phototrophicus methaneseepsis]QPC81593.1 ABC transporter ATP-binding protein [Phototrophicus methaneseepsis]